MEISHEQYIAAFNKLPVPIRSYLIDDEMASVIQAIGTKYNLHVDIIGTLGKGASYMLMGIQSPAETLGELVLAGVDGATAQKILEDLNSQIFIPVREHVKNYKEGDEEQVEDTTHAEMLVQTSTPTPAVSQSPEPVPQPTPVIVSAPQTTPSIPPTPPTPVMPQVSVAPTSPATPEQSMRTMASDVDALHQHRAPEPIPYSAPPPVIPPVPIPPAIPARTTPPPPNLPGAPLTKEYGNDPYREPVE
jgi:hypothetical protein